MRLLFPMLRPKPLPMSSDFTQRQIFIGFLLLLINACSTHKPDDIKDSAPNEVRDWHNIPDAIPKPEPRARYGNHSPYVVFGQKYHVLPSSKGYQETGIASWYGKKFAGRPTSSQEPYDPYAMTAAHKSLPLPTYVRVTNLDNNKSIVVRVNDRGPFHEDRIIDLSYAAAHKLEYANHGTARVRVEAIDMSTLPSASSPTPLSTPSQPSKPSQSYRLFLQAGAFKEYTTAQSLKHQLSSFTEAPIKIDSNQNGQQLHRVKIGPFPSAQHALQAQQRIQNSQLAKPMLIKQ